MPYPASYPNWVFSLFSGLGFVLCCIPFPWHLEAWNTGTCLYMAWVGISCLILCINSIVWNSNAINWAPVWCDISSRVIVGLNVAVPACSLCITRRLYRISSVKSVTITKAEKYRQIMIDFSIGLGIPVLAMILQYIVQGHRFNIYEEVGCLTFTCNTPMAYVLVSFPPLILGLISAIYAILTIRAFYKTQNQSREMLSNYSNLTSSRYFRLMALASVDIICTIPLASYVISANASIGFGPWMTWEEIHAGFSRVDQIPSMLWRSNSRAEMGLEMLRWSTVTCAFLFFAFFGFADEARKNYRFAVSSVAKRVGISTSSFGNSLGLASSGGGVSSVSSSMPGFTTEKRRNSYEDSFSDASSNLKDVGGYFNSPTSPIDEKKGSSFTSVFGLKKKLGEEVFRPGFQYDDLMLPDVGGALASDDDVLTIPSSDTSSISIPEPAITRPTLTPVRIPSRDTLPVDVPISVSVTDDTRRHSHDMV